MENQRERGGKKPETKEVESLAFHCPLTTGLSLGPEADPESLQTRPKRPRQGRVREPCSTEAPQSLAVFCPATFMLKEPFSPTGGAAGLSSRPLLADTWLYAEGGGGAGRAASQNRWAA